jgi:hypothetical protein
VLGLRGKPVGQHEHGTINDGPFSLLIGSFGPKSPARPDPVHLWPDYQAAQPARPAQSAATAGQSDSAAPNGPDGLASARPHANRLTLKSKSLIHIPPQSAAVPASAVRRRQRRSGRHPKPNPNSLVSPSLASLASRQPLRRSPAAHLSHHRSTSSRPAFSPPHYRSIGVRVRRTACRTATARAPATLASLATAPTAGRRPSRPPATAVPPAAQPSTEHPSNGDSRAGGRIRISSTTGQASTAQQRERVRCSLVSPAALRPTPPAPASIRAATPPLSPSTTSPLDGTASLLFKIFSRPKRLSSNAQPSKWNAILLPRTIHQR